MQPSRRLWLPSPTLPVPLIESLYSDLRRRSVCVPNEDPLPKQATRIVDLHIHFWIRQKSGTSAPNQTLRSSKATASMVQNPKQPPPGFNATPLRPMSKRALPWSQQGRLSPSDLPDCSTPHQSLAQRTLYRTHTNGLGPLFCSAAPQSLAHQPNSTPLAPKPKASQRQDLPRRLKLHMAQVAVGLILGSLISAAFGIPTLVVIGPTTAQDGFGHTPPQHRPCRSTVAPARFGGQDCPIVITTAWNTSLSNRSGRPSARLS